MSLILNIDTALDSASICLTNNTAVLQTSICENQKDHASWLHTAIASMLKKSEYKITDLEGVAVSIGPGSYTGLRVGLAAAKGLCYALNIPLMAVNTLKIIANAVKEEATECIAPLIDARRMEVYTALYDKTLEEKTPAHTMIIDDKSFSTLLTTNKILFCGNGVTKLKGLIQSNNASFNFSNVNATHLAQLSLPLFHKKAYADLAYIEPLYVKEFYTNPGKQQ